MITYEDALVWRMTGKVSILSWILQQIQDDPDEIIGVRVKDLKNAFGPEFADKEDMVFTESVKLQLKKYGIKLTKRKRENDLLLLLSYEDYKPIYNRNKI